MARQDAAGTVTPMAERYTTAGLARRRPVAVFTVLPGAGGSAFAGTEVARRLAGSGVDVHIVTARQAAAMVLLETRAAPGLTTTLSSAVDAAGVHWHWPTPPAIPTPVDDLLAGRRFGAALRAVIEIVDPDWINAHYLLPALLELESVDLARTIASAHGSDVHHLAPDLAAAVGQRLARCGVRTAPSRQLADVVQDISGAPCAVIGNWVDGQPATTATREMLRRQWGTGRSVVLAHASNLRPVKQPTHCVTALAAVVHEGHDAELWVIGDGPGRTAIDQAADELGVSDRVVQFGYCTDAVERISAADLLLLPSSSEGQGRVVLEALSCGVAVVTTPIAPLAAYVDADTGVQSSLFDPGSFAAAACEALGNGVVGRARRAGPDRVAGVHPDRLFPNWQELFDQVVDQARRDLRFGPPGVSRHAVPHAIGGRRSSRRVERAGFSR